MSYNTKRRRGRPKLRVVKRRPAKDTTPKGHCRLYPSWTIESCAHCQGTGRTHGVRREFMSAAEREEIFQKTGRHVESTSDVRRVYAETGMREAEKGEDCHELFDALRDHAETGAKLDHKHTVPGMDVFGKSVRKPNENFDARKRYEYHRQRLGLNN